jgi:hypothetical protein
MNHLTPGQQRIREILENYHDQFKPFKSSQDPTRESGFDDFAHEVISSFSQDPAILNDPVTSQSLLSSTSSKYIGWRRQIAETTNIKYPMTEYQGAVRFDRFEYVNGSDSPAFLGGRKWNVTISILMSLSTKSKIPVPDLDSTINYYPTSGILEAESGSCHRMLACVLFGELLVRPEQITVCEENVPDDPELFRACLIMDALQRIQFPHRGIPEFPTIDQISKHRKLLLNLSAEEVQVLGHFIFEHDQQDFLKLKQAINIYRRWHNAWLPFQKRYIKFVAPKHLGWFLNRIEKGISLSRDRL